MNDTAPELQNLALSEDQLAERVSQAQQEPLSVLGGLSPDEWFDQWDREMDKVPQSGEYTLAAVMTIIYVYQTCQPDKMKEVRRNKKREKRAGISLPCFVD